jgi:hypothetical protein
MNVFEANLKMKLDEIERLKAENRDLRELLEQAYPIVDGFEYEELGERINNKLKENSDE